MIIISFIDNPNAAWSSSSSSPTESQHNVNNFSMDRTITKVAHAWKEWHIGYPGKPSIKSLDLAGNKEWRKGDRERKHYSRRHKVIKFIEEESRKKGIIPEVFISLLEEGPNSIMKKNGITSLYGLRLAIERKQLCM